MSRNTIPFPNYNITATIASGATVSEAVELDKYRVVGVFIPSNFDGTTLTISVAPALDGTYLPAQSSAAASTPWTVTVAAGQYVPLVISGNGDPAAGFRYIKFTSGSSQTTTDTVLTLACVNRDS